MSTLKLTHNIILPSPCLTTALNGLYFSFTQTNLKEGPGSQESEPRVFLHLNDDLSKMYPVLHLMTSGEWHQHPPTFILQE